MGKLNQQSTPKTKTNTKGKKAPPRANVAGSKPKTKTKTKTEPAQKGTESKDVGTKEKLKAYEKLAVKTGNLVARIGNIKKKVERWDHSIQKDTIIEHLQTALDAIDKAATAFDDLPDDFVPRARRGGGGGKKVTLEKGTEMRIRDKYTKKYAGAVSVEDKLVVEQVLGNGTVALNLNGGTIFIVRRELQLWDAPSSDDSEEAKDESAA